MTHTFQIFWNKKCLLKYLTDRKLKMSACFIFEIKPAKTDKIFIFLKDRFSVMSGPMDMIFGLFSETYMRLLKHIIFQFFLNVKSCLKLTFLNKKKQTMLRLSNYMYLIELYKKFSEWAWLSLRYLQFLRFSVISFPWKTF